MTRKEKEKLSDKIFTIVLYIGLWGNGAFYSLLFGINPYIPKDVPRYPIIILFASISIIFALSFYRADEQDTRIKNLEKELERVKNETIHSSK